MSQVDARSSFTGSIPENYDRYLGRAWIDAFAEDLARRLPARPPGDVLELACGTGLVTHRLRERLDPSLKLVATDISKGMLDHARGKYPGLAGVEWREADALDLPFPDAAFGAVVCGLGFMFMPDRARALREARRVVREGGLLLFSVWDRLEDNPTAMASMQVIEGIFPGDEEMRFTLPFEMHDPSLLQELLRAARFAPRSIETTRVAIDGPSARDIATGLIRGTPRSSLIEKRGVSLDTVIEKVAAALALAGGEDPYRSAAQCVVVEAVAE